MATDGRNCMYAIETGDTYVSGNPETRDNTITIITYEFSMASNCKLNKQTLNLHSSMAGAVFYS